MEDATPAGGNGRSKHCGPRWRRCACVIEEQTAPDYALTLGAIARELETVATRLTTIEGHPALAMTPGAIFRATHRRREGRAHQGCGKAMRDVQGQLGNAARQLERSAGNIHTREEQQRRIGIALGGRRPVGDRAVALPLPSLLPWGAGDWLVSSLIGGGAPAVREKRSWHAPAPRHSAGWSCSTTFAASNRLSCARARLSPDRPPSRAGHLAERPSVAPSGSPSGSRTGRWTKIRIPVDVLLLMCTQLRHRENSRG